MAIILSIETSTSVCSAALHENGELIADRELHTPQSAASQLSVQIDQLFSVTHISKKSLDAVAISAGPGSYTGLRIGAATAKGICFGLDTPLIAVDSLLALAAQVTTPVTDFLCPMIDARRMEVYCALFNQDLSPLMGTQAKVIEAGSFSDLLSSKTISFFGDGAVKCKDVIDSQKALFIDNIHATAKGMGVVAWNKFKVADFAHIELFEPNYLKDFVAKTKSR